MGDRDGLIESLRRVARVGQRNDWFWDERYYSAKTGNLAAGRSKSTSSTREPDPRREPIPAEQGATPCSRKVKSQSRQAAAFKMFREPGLFFKEDEKSKIEIATSV
jgi:hypothetical protein